MKLFRRTPSDFDFQTAVGSYGFFALAPNQWDPEAGRLTTVLPAGELVLGVRITAVRRAGHEGISIDAPEQKSLPPEERKQLLGAANRMLRLDEDFAAFHALCADDAGLSMAAKLRFGRLLRSPTLFEDVIKTICTCNITWAGTQSMVRRMVAEYGSAATNDTQAQAFPTPGELAATTERKLNRTCGVGYRAEWIITFARQVLAGAFDVAKCEDPELPTEELYRYLRTIRGVGDYAASSLCALLGRYDRIAIDTETVKHFRLRFPRRKPTQAKIKKHYARYNPYQYLVYWWELWSRYVDETGHPSSWTRG